MSHLTMSQILQFVDGTADYASQAQCTNHLAACAQCRREVELHKRMLRVGKNLVIRPSSRFTERVMASVAPGTGISWSAKFLNNLANIFAMMIVLGILVYALSSTSGFKVGESRELSAVTKIFSDEYAKIKHSVGQKTDQLSVQVNRSSSEKTSKLFVFALVTLLALAAVDRFVLREIMKTKH